MKWLDNMVLQSKLILLTTVMLMALVALGFLGYSTTVKWNDSVTQIGKVNVPSILGLMKMRTGLGDVVLQVARVNGFEPGPKAQEKLKGVLKQIDEGFVLYKEGYDIYASLAQTPEAASIWKKYEEDYKNWKDIQVEFRTQIVEPYSNTGDMKLQSEYSAKVQPYIDRMRLHRQAMIDGINKVTDINEASSYGC